ncbi:MAG: hypothetical protein EHM12_01480 [Dehalococcoidia bacterium]|nr:MAG: hypothetical protein EHM12_01480 [Dehalococcoidia bacterium]
MNLQPGINIPAGKARRPIIYAALLITIPIVCSGLLSSCVTVKSSSEEPYYVTELATENRTETYTETVPVERLIRHEQPLQPYILWSNPELTFNKHKSLWYYGYDLSGFTAHNKQKIRIMFFKQQFYEYTAVSVFDMHPRGQILAPPLIATSDNISAIVVLNSWISSKQTSSTFNTWIGMANMKLDFAHFLGGSTDLFMNRATASPVELDTRGSQEIAILINGPTDPQNCRFSVSLTWEEPVTENVTRTFERTIPVQVEHKILKQKSVPQYRQVPFWEALIPGKP